MLARFSVAYERFCRLLLTIFVVNIAMLVHTLLGAVVLGFFPSCAAAQTTFRTWLRAEDRSMRAKEVWGIFHGAWKNELKQANLFGWPLAVCWVVLATTLTGYLAEVNWHLPFLVYLFPFVSVFLTRYLKKDLSNYHSSDDIPADTVREMGKRGINVKALVKLMAFYGLATYLVIIISFNLPFLMEEYGLSSGRAGILISLFFLAIMAPGFVLNKIVQVLGRRIYMVCLLMIACGMGIILLSRSEILIALGCILNGLSYGIIQPLIYDKTSDVAVPHKVTLALAFVMAMNYVAILLCPFIVDAFQNLFHSHSQTFAFWLNLMVALMGMFIVMKQEKLSL